MPETPRPPEKDMIFIDAMSERSLKRELQYKVDMIQHAEVVVANLMLERSRIMDAACQSKFHRKWARRQDNSEQLFKEQRERPSIARSIMPVRRIPWSEQEEE